MRLVQWWNDADMGMPNYSGRIKCHLVEHITNVDCAAIETCPFPVKVLALRTSVSSTFFSDNYDSETCL